MSPTTILLLLLIGLAAGSLGSMVGIGGGIVVVPALIALTPLIPGMGPKMAAGTSLAMLLPPIGILGVMEYYKRGNVNISVAVVLCIGFIAGAWLGGQVANRFSNEGLKKFFAVFLIAVGIYFLFFEQKLKRGTKAYPASVAKEGDQKRN